MPQKVNPINFENAEGNLKLTNAGLDFFCIKITYLSTTERFNRFYCFEKLWYVFRIYVVSIYKY